MVSTFHGLEMGKRSLITHTQALNVTGHNINNLNTEGYTRQVINIQEYEPIFMPDMTREERPGQLGQGSTVLNIVRVRDALLDNRIIFEKKDLGYFEVRNKYIQQMELVYSEPSTSNDPSMDGTLRTSFNEFMNSWADLANHPDEKGARDVVLERANILTNSIKHHFDSFTDIRGNVDKEIQDRVSEVNQIAQKIAHLNGKILNSESMGDNPNDWYDQRDLLIDKLSKIVDVQISREDKDELIIFIGGKMLVQGQKYEQLNKEAQDNNEGYFDVFWADKEKLTLRGGELAALFDLRDKDLREEIKKVDSFAVNITDITNEIHKNGFGSNGKTGSNFFVEFPFTTDVAGNYDKNKDGMDDSTYLFRISGSNKLDINDKIGIRGTMDINGIKVNYNDTDTLGEVIRKINDSGARVNAFLNTSGNLTIKADYQVDTTKPDFVIQHLEDSGLFLTGYAGVLKTSGNAGSFDWQTIDQVNKLSTTSNWAVAPLVHPSAYMKVDEKIAVDHSYIATALGTDVNGDGKSEISNGIGDSQNALKMASLKDARVMVGMSLTVSQYFESVISDVGARGSHAEKGFKSAEIIVENLDNLRKSISGVNMDEEFANMMKFQHGYNAIAKVMTEMDKMIETLITKLG